MNGRFEFNNEWFLIASMGIELVLYWRLPKRFFPSVRVQIGLLSALMAQTADHLIGIQPYDMYDYLDNPSLELTYAIAQFVQYPLMAYFFLYFYEKWRLRGGRLAGYVLGWVAFSTGYEYWAVHLGVLNYKGWKIYYSPPVYLAVFIILLFFFHYVRKLRYT